MISNLPISIASAFTFTNTNTLYTSRRVGASKTSRSNVRNTCLFSLKPAAIPLMDSGEYNNYYISLYLSIKHIFIDIKRNLHLNLFHFN